MIPVALAQGGFIKSVPAGTHIIFWYDNPKSRGSKGWRRGFVRESQNDYILTYDQARQGETRKFCRRYMAQLSII